MYSLPVLKQDYLRTYDEKHLSPLSQQNCKLKMLHSDYNRILDPQILLKGRVNVTLCILLYFGDFDTFMVQVHIYKRDFRYLSLLSSFYNAKRGSNNYFEKCNF